MAAVHRLDPSVQTVHWGHFDAAIPPVLAIDPGDTVWIDTVSGGHLEVCDPALFDDRHRHIVENVPQLMGPHILTGPIEVRGARPGDTLEVRILDIALTVPWGWNVIRPLRGALPEDFPYLSRRVIPIDLQRCTARLPWGVELPLRPFFGIIGVAPPPAYGRVSSIEPREFGGNMDNQELRPGSSVFLPVFVPGARLSVGDGHAVQGDGEVCLTALETCMKGKFEIRLHRRELEFPCAVTASHLVTMGFDPDLDDAARDALRRMIRWLTRLMGWTPEEAYVFCSLACDLRVTQIVDGNKGIHAMVDRALLQLQSEPLP
jgi:acetamidase/formamidase